MFNERTEENSPKVVLKELSNDKSKLNIYNIPHLLQRSTTLSPAMPPSLSFHQKYKSRQIYIRLHCAPSELPLAPNTSCRFGLWMFKLKALWFAWLNMVRQGNRSEGLQTQAFRGMRLCQAARRWWAHCTDVTSHTAWTKEELEGPAKITHLTDSGMYSTVNITEHAAMTRINHQSYLLTFINAKPFQRQTFSQR